jgi:GNAT superfamily N-acetyltransferase
MEERRVEVYSGKDVEGSVSGKQVAEIIRILDEATEDKPQTIMDRARGEMALVDIPALSARLMKDVARGVATVVLEDNKLAAFASIFQRGRMYDGRDIYEIGNAVTLPEYRGRGYIKKAIEAAIALALEEHPHNPVSLLTKNRSLKKMFDEKGWQQIGAWGFFK